ncbi:hypothetical protein C8R46DRAFT_1084726 [Mycena filopes]|nr:hypothetical protein C8R46DRAFT_1084726 [Mycena filopes]
MSSIESTLLFGSSRLRNIENQAQTLIEVAEANIQRLTTQIDELTIMRERERSVLARLRLMVLPIGRLPVEVLVEVFKIAVHSPLSFVSWSWSRSSTEPVSALQKVLNLSHVSPYWRQIVHSTPRLWAETVVGVSFGRELTDRYFDGLDSLLARSSPFPISVSIDGDPKAPQASPTTTKTSQRLALSLAPTAQRWKNLQIAVDFIPHLQNLPRGAFEMLEQLHITSPSAPVEDPILVFESSPHLRRLTVYSAYARTLHLLRLPWSRLTHLNVHDLSMEGCRTALLQCSSLVWARMITSSDWDSSSPADHSPVITLPFLHTLNLEFQGEPDSEEVHSVEAFFLPLALPSLKILQIELDNLDGLWPTTVFTGFQNRSPNIEHFSLSYSGIGSAEFITFLRHSPALQTLQLQSCWDCIDDESLDAFRYDEEDSAPLVPKLENLLLTNIGFFDDSSFEAAIRSRWWKEEGRVLPDGSSPRVSRLKTVSVTTIPNIEVDHDIQVKARMQELIDEGLQLTW